ncbi:MAG: hypothetical protein J6Y89_08215, partial [Lachnospiraceae bacterium]|nr:hypothetical protein [Lachnospiraceae bacterium]
ADNGREELSIENRRECIRRIASFDHYAKLWDANIKRYEGSEEYINCLIENNKPVQDELKKPGAQRSLERVNALQHLVSMKSEDLKRRKLDFDPELTAQITDAERQYEYGDMVLEEMDRAKEFFTKHHGDFLRASSEILRQNQSVNETKKYIFTPEETLNLRREKAKADFYLNQLEDKLAARLNEKQVKSIFERFNRMAEEKGFAVRANWHTDEDAAKNFKNIRLAADNEHTPLYFEAIMAEAVNFGDVLEGLADEMDAVRLPSELSLEEMSDYPEQQRIADLKTGVNADQNLNADEKQKKNDMLDKVNKYLAVRKESVYKYLSDAEERTGITGMEYINASQDNDIYHDERYNNMTVMKGVAPNAIAVIPPEKEQALNDLLADPPAISKDVADNVAKIVQKMEEYGMITGNQNMEQSKKYYGYIKLAEARKNLKTAVEKGDMAEIETATAAYEVEHRHVEEIQEMIRRSFPDDLFAPGNVDTIRNEEIPPEFSTDMVTDMKFNGIFQVAEYSKRCGVSVQDFLANPGKSIMDHYKRSAVEKGLDSKTKDHKNFMESFNYLINAEEADMSLAYMNEVVGGRVPISMDRALQPVILLETDPGRRAEQFRYLDRIKPLGEAYAANEEIALRFVNNVYTMYGSNIGKENFDRLVNGLKSAFLEGSPIQKRHLGLPVVDENGIGREDAFNYDNVLNQKDRYNVITENYHKALADAQKCDIPAAKLLMQSALFDYLMAHPEDMDNPVYKDFEKLAINAGKDLGLPQEDSAKLVSNYNTWRDSISSERRMMAQIAAESDREVDLRIRDLQKPLSEKLGAARNRVSYRPGREPQEVQDLKDEIKEIADARIQELIDAYRAKQITESYLKERYAQLDALRKDTTIDISKRNLPDIVAPHGSEQYEKDMALINDRVRNKAWTGNLRSLDAYIEYRLSQDPNLEKGDLSNEQWRDAWQNAIRVEAVKQRGQVEDDLPAGIVEPYAEIARESLKNNIINNGQDGPQVEEIPEPMEQKKGDRKFYDEISKGLAGEDVQERPVELGLPVYRSASESYLINNMRVRVDSWENGEAGKNLYGYVANLVAIQLIEGRDGRVPGRMTFQGFSKKMRDDASFRAVVKPLFDEVYNEYRDYKQRYDAASPQEKEN